MTIFLKDFTDYLVAQRLATTGKCFFDFYPDGAEDFIAAICYDHIAEDDERYIQITARNTTATACIEALNAIYNHFFTTFAGRAGNKTINTIPCFFRALTKPTYLKRENGLFYYVFNLKVTNIKG